MPVRAEDPVRNPYDAAAERDRHALWQALIARDSESFVQADWSLCADDFASDRFEGISAHGSWNPIHWTLRYPTLESYRDDWLAMAERYLATPLAAISHRDLLYRMQQFAKVEISGDRAVVWKQFAADEPLSDGGRYQIAAQSVYRLHRLRNRWLIVGFVGYLPMESRGT
ncbi:MAG: hypothetical protein IT424_05895 [Pirellulales bacterium]|nr:hypothetical protein [Pirellulales bacterium]